MAAELHPLFERAYDAPETGTEISIALTTTNYASREQASPVHVAEVRFAVHDEVHAELRRALWTDIEALTRVRYTLPRICADTPGDASCWICCTSARIADVATWVDLPCCRQALCVDCLLNHVGVPPPGSSFKLFPTCPFCAVPLADAILERAGLAARYAHLRGNVLLAPEPGVKYVHSVCSGCDGVIATPATCAIDGAALPLLCSNCALPPKGADTKPCPFSGCGVLISRIDGCNNVCCTLCGNSMCWLCGQGVVDHDEEHFLDDFFGDECAGLVVDA
jgi:hypothetical protein